MNSIRDFVVLLSAAIILLLGCSALAGMLNLTRILEAREPVIPYASPILAEGVVSILARPTFAEFIGFNISAGAP